jgi:FAD/FMN-containing dehydrogenase
VGFPSFEAGFGAVAEMFALGLRPALVDLTEEPPGGEVLLYLVFEGCEEEVEAQQARALRVCCESGGEDLGPGEALHYWDTRYEIAEVYRKELMHYPPRKRWKRLRVRFDYIHVALPLSRVLEYKARCHKILTRRNIRVQEYAIWTQPELFSLLMFSTALGGEPAVGMGEAVDELLSLAQDMGGTMEYCHGVGIKLAHLLGREMGVGLEVVRAMKRALDPNNIMNPGKLGL